MNTEKARHLLQRYYDGTATADELAALKQYFVEADNIPADLRADAAIFRAMSKRRPATPPADLMQRITAATVESPRRRFHFNWKSGLSAAAVVAAIFGLGFLFIDKTEDTAEMPMIAKTEAPAQRPAAIVKSSPDIVEETTAAIAEEKAPAVAKEASACKAEVKHIAKAAAAHKAVFVAKGQVSESLAGTYREVTDSAEVVQITTELLATLDANFGKMERGVRNTEMAVSIIADPFNAGKIKDGYDRQ